MVRWSICLPPHLYEYTIPKLIRTWEVMEPLWPWERLETQPLPGDSQVNHQLVLPDGSQVNHQSVLPDTCQYNHQMYCSAPCSLISGPGAALFLPLLRYQAAERRSSSWPEKGCWYHFLRDAAAQFC
jgi:hypothetical protein